MEDIWGHAYASFFAASVAKERSKGNTPTANALDAIAEDAAWYADQALRRVVQARSAAYNSPASDH